MKLNICSISMLVLIAAASVMSRNALDKYGPFGPIRAKVRELAAARK